MKFTLYSLSFGKLIYYGITNNVTRRMYCHKARFNKKIDGWSYPVYNSFRKATKSWNKIELNIIGNFKTREKAILAENKMIAMHDCLNSDKKGK